MGWYFIEACDVLMFRDGRPFSAGENHLVHSLFPPTALTVQGAIRSHILTRDGYLKGNVQTQAHPDVGEGDKLGRFSMHGPYVALRRQLGSAPGTDYLQCIPLPLDIAFQRLGSFSLLQPEPPDDDSWANWPGGALWSLQGNDLDDLPGECWLGAEEFNTYYVRGYPPYRADEASPGGVWTLDELVLDEPRFGIGMDHALRIVDEGLLYRAAFKRTARFRTLEVGLLTWIGDDVPLASHVEIIGIGGEGRTAYLQPVDDDQVIQIDSASAQFGNGPTWRFKIVLTTPAWFRNQWSPERCSVWPDRFGAEELMPTLLTAAVSRPMLLGGWKMGQGPRSVLRLAPAGSVFYFEGLALPRTDVALTDQPDGFPNLAALGYGRYVVLPW